MACFTTPPPLAAPPPSTASLPRRPPRRGARVAAPRPRGGARLTMGVRAVPSYDGAFELSEVTRFTLVGLLSDAAFCAQVAGNSGAEAAEFTDVLFQPVPYSPGTPRGTFYLCHFSY